jgi:hypothetical protein
MTGQRPRRSPGEKIQAARVGNQVRITIAWWRTPLLLDLDEAGYLGSELLKAASGASDQGGPRPSGRNARQRRARVLGSGGRS